MTEKPIIDAPYIVLISTLVDKLLRKRLVEVSKNALQGESGKDGLDGENGRDGVDGLSGEDGRDGRDGLNGRDGTAGKNGSNGKNGLDGQDGKKGTVGKQGLKGDPGKDGKDGLDGEGGRGIKTMRIIADGNVVVQYDDGSVETVGQAQVNNISNISGVNGIPADHFVIHSVKVQGNTLILGCNNGKRFEVTLPSSGGGGFTATFETVSKNLDAVNATITYGVDGISTIIYASGVVKTLNYGVNGLSSIVLSGAVPGGIDLTKTLNYTLGEFTGWTYS